MQRRLALAVLTCFGIVAGRVASAQPSNWEFWPEVEFYTPARSATQLRLLTSWTADEDSAYRQLQVGAYVRSRAVSHLLLEAGYSYYETPAEPSKDENRLVAELTVDFNLPAQLVLLDRNRFEWRWVGGNYSTRYRNRLRLERAVPLGPPHTVTPYFQVEAYYTISEGRWSRIKEQIGALYLITPEVTIDGGFAHQNDLNPSTNNIDAIELTLRVYW
jgi:hypothetical protein